MSNHLGFACHTCKARTGTLGERMNRAWSQAEVAVEHRVAIRDMLRIALGIAEKSKREITLWVGLSYSGSPYVDLDLLEFHAWFEKHADHEMVACSESEYTAWSGREPIYEEE